MSGSFVTSGEPKKFAGLSEMDVKHRSSGQRCQTAIDQPQLGVSHIFEGSAHREANFHVRIGQALVSTGFVP